MTTCVGEASDGNGARQVAPRSTRRVQATTTPSYVLDMVFRRSRSHVTIEVSGGDVDERVVAVLHERAD
eukprot:3000807-Pyramimonas_sp.AAC.1